MVGPVVLPANGIYTVVVDPSGSWTGQVAVTAYDVVDVTGAVTVNGSAVSADLTAPGQRGLWTFEGVNGQKVRAAMNSSTVPIR